MIFLKKKIILFLYQQIKMIRKWKLSQKYKMKEQY